MKALTPFEQALEFTRTNDIFSEADSIRGTFWADQAFQQMADETLGQALYNYLMSVDEMDRGNIYSAL